MKIQDSRSEAQPLTPVAYYYIIIGTLRGMGTQIEARAYARYYLFFFNHVQGLWMSLRQGGSRIGRR